MYLWTNDYLESAINEGSENVEGWEYRERKKNNVFKELRVRALTMKASYILADFNESSVAHP